MRFPECHFEFYRKHGGSTIKAIDMDTGDEITGVVMSASWRGTLGVRLPDGSRAYVLYDPDSIEILAKFKPRGS